MGCEASTDKAPPRGLPPAGRQLSGQGRGGLADYQFKKEGVEERQPLAMGGVSGLGASSGVLGGSAAEGGAFDWSCVRTVTAAEQARAWPNAPPGLRVKGIGAGVDGTYQLVKGAVCNAFPVWRATHGAGMAVFVGRDGRWRAAAVDGGAGWAGATPGFVSADVHRDRLPHEMYHWRVTRAQATDPRIAVSAVALRGQSKESFRQRSGSTVFSGSAHPHVCGPLCADRHGADLSCLRCGQPGAAHASRPRGDAHVCADGGRALFAWRFARDAGVGYSERDVRPVKNAEGRLQVKYVGTEVTATAHGGPAWRAGIRPGDRIVRINGAPMHEGLQIQRTFLDVLEHSDTCVVTVGTPRIPGDGAGGRGADAVVVGTSAAPPAEGEAAEALWQGDWVPCTVYAAHPVSGLLTVLWQDGSVSTLIEDHVRRVPAAPVVGVVAPAPAPARGPCDAAPLPMP